MVAVSLCKWDIGINRYLNFFVDSASQLQRSYRIKLQENEGVLSHQTSFTLCPRIHQCEEDSQNLNPSPNPNLMTPSQPQRTAARHECENGQNHSASASNPGTTISRQPVPRRRNFVCRPLPCQRGLRTGSRSYRKGEKPCPRPTRRSRAEPVREAR